MKIFRRKTRKPKPCKCGALTRAQHAQCIERGWKLHTYGGPKGAKK